MQAMYLAAGQRNSTILCRRKSKLFYSEVSNMAKKSTQSSEPVVPEQIMELAKKSLDTDKIKVTKRCFVCGSDYAPSSAPNQDEELCWVCRRLKISAWREVDQQISAQE